MTRFKHKSRFHPTRLSTRPGEHRPQDCDVPSAERNTPAVDACGEDSRPALDFQLDFDFDFTPGFDPTMPLQQSGDAAVCPERCAPPARPVLTAQDRLLNWVARDFQRGKAVQPVGMPAHSCPVVQAPAAPCVAHPADEAGGARLSGTKAARHAAGTATPLPAVEQRAGHVRPQRAAERTARYQRLLGVHALPKIKRSGPRH